MTAAVSQPLAAGLRLSLAPLDYALLIIYFVFVIGIGFALRRLVQTSTDFFLSGRSLPTWITGIAFISANLGAIEILSMAANGAEYGISTVHYYWIGAVPAMVFLGVVMMPFYYGSRVRSVPEYLLRRFDRKTHLVTALIFVLASVLIAGVNLYALAFVLESLLGIPLAVAIIASALFVLSYILLGGLSSAIYNEVMQFFVILLALIPVIIVVLKETGGIHGLFSKLATQGASFTHPWNGTSLGGHNPFGDWIGIVFGLGFCLSFAYWTTNFAEVQRGMSAKDESSARLTPIVAAYPKVIIPLGTVIPGMAAILLIPGLGTAGGLTYNDAIPALYNQYLPLGVLGVAVTGLLAAFMAGMAANVSSFNAVWTYDIWQNYIRPGRPDQYYLRVGRITTVVGVFIGIGTAFLAAGYSNIGNYFQALFSFFNVPIFVTFILGMFWRKVGRGSGFYGLIVGTVFSFGTWLLYKQGVIHFRSDIAETQWGAIIGFVAGAAAMAIATIWDTPKPLSALHGLVWGYAVEDEGEAPGRPPARPGTSLHCCGASARSSCACCSTSTLRLPRGGAGELCQRTRGAGQGRGCLRPASQAGSHPGGGQDLAAGQALRPALVHRGPDAHLRHPGDHPGVPREPGHDRQGGRDQPGAVGRRDHAGARRVLPDLGDTEAAAAGNHGGNGGHPQGPRGVRHPGSGRALGVLTRFCACLSFLTASDLWHFSAAGLTSQEARRSPSPTRRSLAKVINFVRQQIEKITTGPRSRSTVTFVLALAAGRRLLSCWPEG